MIKFSWEYTPSKKSTQTYIHWTATWDGRWDNEELLDEQEKNNHPYTNFGHPFSETVDYEQTKAVYERYKNMSEEEKKEPLIIHVIQDDGSVKEEDWGNNENINPEEHNPAKLFKCGDTVAVNSVTRALCDLLSDPEKIRMASGNMHPVSYRATLLGCLSRLWD